MTDVEKKGLTDLARFLLVLFFTFSYLVIDTTQETVYFLRKLFFSHNF